MKLKKQRIYKMILKIEINYHFVSNDRYDKINLFVMWLV
jgi:hypothetical protein